LDLLGPCCAAPQNAMLCVSRIGLSTSANASLEACIGCPGCLCSPSEHHSAWGPAGWVLFMVFAGVGLVALPLDLVQSFLGRPVAVITKSEYIKRARGLGQRAAAVKARP
jgi:hypothetical protein